MSSIESKSKVYKVSSVGNGPIDHVAIFIETSPTTGEGQVYHVIGSIQQGMQYETKPSPKPEDSLTFLNKQHIGYIKSDKLDRVHVILSSLAAPPKQFEGPKCLVDRHEIRRCTEWTEDAIQLLQSEKILLAQQQNHPNDDDASP